MATSDARRPWTARQVLLAVLAFVVWMPILFAVLAFFGLVVVNGIGA